MDHFDGQVGIFNRGFGKNAMAKVEDKTLFSLHLGKDILHFFLKSLLGTLKDVGVEIALDRDVGRRLRA